MKIGIYKNSSVGAVVFFIELFLTMLVLNFIINDYYKINIHLAIRLVSYVILSLILLSIFTISKIGCIIISILYSVMWGALAYGITNEATHGDKIWLCVITGAVFLISIGIHISFRNDSGADYIVENLDNDL